MDSSTNKIDSFTSAFLQEATQRASDIISGVNESREQIRKETEAALKLEIEDYTKTELANIYNREGSRVSAHMLENKRILLSYREQCAQEVVTDVIRRISEFVQSDKYGEHLVNLFAESIKHLKSDSSIVVILRKEDMHHSKAISDAAKSMNISLREGDFTLGGLVILCPSSNLRIDQTFDASLEDIRSHFAELSGIDLE